MIYRSFVRFRDGFNPDDRANSDQPEPEPPAAWEANALAEEPLVAWWLPDTETPT